MTLTRREFLRTSAATGAAVGLSTTLAGILGNPGHLLAADAIYRAEPAPHPIKLLILGGTAFLGPAIVDAALVRGHTITLFNRGKTNPQLYPELEKLRGDRNGDLEALAGRQWDAVIDTSGYYPRVVKMSAELLAPNVGHYTFISSISVYRDFKTPDMIEAAPVGTIDDPTIEEITGETYGPLKALCEQAAEAAMPGRVANVRPGLIVGPRDRSDRFTYWPVRIARGGEVLCPGNGDDFIQIIDVRDLGEWLVMLSERRITGIYNADSAPRAITMGSLLAKCREVCNPQAELVWTDAEFLAEHEVQAWSHMPCWVPAEGDEIAFALVSTAKAQAVGLGRRSLDDTIRDTLAWWQQQPAERRQKMRAGMDPEREVEVLKAWHERVKG